MLREIKNINGNTNDENCNINLMSPKLKPQKAPKRKSFKGAS